MQWSNVRPLQMRLDTFLVWYGPMAEFWKVWMHQRRFRLGRLPVGVPGMPGSTRFSTIPCGHSFKRHYRLSDQGLNVVDRIFGIYSTRAIKWCQLRDACKDYWEKILSTSQYFSVQKPPQRNCDVHAQPPLRPLYVWSHEVANSQLQVSKLQGF